MVKTANQFRICEDCGGFLLDFSGDMLGRPKGDDPGCCARACCVLLDAAVEFG
jgi:hypothetical protein